MRLKILLAIVVIGMSEPGHADTLPQDAEHTNIAPDDPLAVSRLRHLIEKLEREHGYFSISLYRPLRHLGLIQLETGQAAESLDAFSRMQHIVHRHHGVDSVYQLESVDYAIDALTVIGDARQADTRHAFRLRTAEKGFAPDGPELLYARLTAADWYRNTARYQQATTLYEKAIEMLPAEDFDLALRIYRSRALTSYLSNRCCADQELRQAMQISEHETFDHVEREIARRDFMDMARIMSWDAEDLELRLAISQPSGNQVPAYLGFGNAHDFVDFNRSRQAMVPTSRFVSFVEHEPKELIPVGAPVAMCGNTFNELVRNPEGLKLSINLQIDEEGRPVEIEIEGNAPVRLKRYVRDSLQAGIYRPATDVDGSYTRGELTFEQTFGPTNLGINSKSAVSEWHHLMVAQACQVGNNVQI